ncbi:MAG TPA: diadenylate cyclase [Thermodesulfobacteriota bacterium]|nr:diadenylate cyclase [Thermodesulfobacteriota bacterium]
MNPIQFATDIIREIGIPGLFDIAFMSLLIYALLVLFNRTKARFVLTGVIIISLVYLLARQFNLVLTTSVLQTFFAVIFIALIIIFQEEIRQFLEQIALWSLNPQLALEKSRGSSREEIDVLVNTITDLAKERIGALIILPGKTTIESSIEGGKTLNGKLSEPLLKSLLDPHSIGHDGAIIIDNGNVVKFSCHLPLSKNFAMLMNRGTRHAAALGLSEQCDALCLVVSEEKGTISVARNGELREIGSEQLSLVLEKFYSEVNPIKKRRHWFTFFTKNYREKAIAIFMAVALWFVFVHESKLVYRTYNVPVKYTTLPSELKVEDIKPETVKVTFLGPRRAFYFFNEKEVELFLKIPEARKGIKTVNISESSLKFPKDISLENIEPRRVLVRIDNIEPEEEKK